MFGAVGTYVPRPRLCPNPHCEYSRQPGPKWLIRNGTYRTVAHGKVQRYRCRGCHLGMSDQTRSVHYYAKLRIDLKRIFIRIRGGSSMRDIARGLGCSRTAIANAVVRLARQAMASHAVLLPLLNSTKVLCFDGLVSSLTGGDYPSQITTLGDSETELLLAMSHCVTERGGTRTEAQKRRIARRRKVWRPRKRALLTSISLLVHELSRFASPHQLLLDTDKHPLYPCAIDSDLALRWYRTHQLLSTRTTSSTAPRTPSNPLFLMNYLDRMIRHRMKEHTRETIAFARNATMQMHRMWIFAWDHNCCQPMRVAPKQDRSRAEHAGLPSGLLYRLEREFYSRRVSLTGVSVPESMRMVWAGELDTPPVRWRVGQKGWGPKIPAYALRDLPCSYPHAP